MTVHPPLAAAASATAKILLDIKAVHFNAEKPYIFTSGWASPVYIDCRKLISYVPERQTVIKFAREMLQARAGEGAFDAVAGGETAGIPYAAWLAEAMNLPMLYVRKQPKGFGRNAQIEGNFPEGARVLLVEDLASDGKSKVKFVNVLRQAGAKVEHSFVVFHYGIFQSIHQTMSDAGLQLHALCTWWEMLQQARESGYFAISTLDEVEKFLKNPESWSAAHGGTSGEAA